MMADARAPFPLTHLSVNRTARAQPSHEKKKGNKNMEAVVFLEQKR